jgi:hypothetical protein
MMIMMMMIMMMVVMMMMVPRPETGTELPGSSLSSFHTPSSLTSILPDNNNNNNIDDDDDDGSSSKSYLHNGYKAVVIRSRGY